MLIASIVIDGLLRFAPSAWRPMEPGEAEVRYRFPNEAYARNLRNESSVGYGDLAKIGNVKDLREYRSSTFTTDDRGFRTAKSTSRAVGVMFGDSFLQAGTDGETLADQLTQFIGCRVYNAAGPDDKFQRPDVQLITSITARLRLRDGYVVMDRLERLFSEKAKQRETPEPSSLGALVGRGFDLAVQRMRGATRIAEILERGRELTGSSPLKVIAERAFRLLRNDRILPNSYAENVVKATLRNGDWILFYPNELATYERRWPVDVSYWKDIAPELQKVGATLIVVLVPNKYTVYHRLLANPLPSAVEPGELLQRVEVELRAAGVVVVNLTSALERAAMSGLERHEYVYWRDDTHWNERGVAIAAEEIARAVPGLHQACASVRSSADR